MDISNDRLLESLLREEVAYKLGLTVYELDLLDPISAASSPNFGWCGL